MLFFAVYANNGEGQGLYLVCYSKRCVSDDLFLIMNQAIRHYHTDDKYLRVVDAAVKNIVHGIMDFLLVATTISFTLRILSWKICCCVRARHGSTVGAG